MLINATNYLTLWTTACACFLC